MEHKLTLFHITVQSPNARTWLLSYWNFYGALYGPPPLQDMLWGAIWGSLSQISGSKSYFEGDHLRFD